MNHLPKPGNIRNIIFDFGGVLFNIDYRRPFEAFAKLGFNEFDSLYQKSSQSVLFDQLEVGAISNEAFVLAIRQFLPDSVTEAEILNAWNSILLDFPKDRLKMMLDLKKNYRTFLLSNTNAIHVRAFEEIVDHAVGLTSFKSAFEKVYYSNVIGMKKPDPNTFLKVCEWNGLLPSETLFIDDSEQHVKGAIEAGLFGYHLDLDKEDILSVMAGWLESPGRGF